MLESKYLSSKFVIDCFRNLYKFVNFGLIDHSHEIYEIREICHLFLIEICEFVKGYFDKFKKFVNLCKGKKKTSKILGGFSRRGSTDLEPKSC
ncbi:hypothetical protein ACSBR1_035745 [Camellia fascicularis]